MKSTSFFVFLFLACYFVTNFKALLSPVFPPSLANAINLLILSTLFLATIYKWIKRKGFVFESLVLQAIVTIIAIAVLAFFAIAVRGIHPTLVMFGSLRLILPLMILIILLGLSPRGINAVYSFMNKCFAWFIGISIIEFVLPVDFRLSVAKFFLSSKLGFDGGMAMYVFREFGGEIARLGSILFEPITFSVISALFCLNMLKSGERSRAFVGIVMNFLTFGKSGIMILWISISSLLLRRFFVPLAFVFLVIGSYVFMNSYGDMLISFLMSNHTFNDVAPMIQRFSTVGNHMIGLMMGLARAIEFPFLGHGVGTAGFVIATEADKLGIIGPTIFEGNESTIGALAFQLGYVFLVLYMSIYVVFAYKFWDRRDYYMFGMFVGFIAFCFMSESAFSQVVVGDMLLVAVYWLRNSQNLEAGK